MKRNSLFLPIIGRNKVKILKIMFAFCVSVYLQTKKWKDLYKLFYPQIRQLVLNKHNFFLSNHVKRFIKHDIIKQTHAKYLFQSFHKLRALSKNFHIYIIVNKQQQNIFMCKHYYLSFDTHCFLPTKNIFLKRKL